MLHCIINSSFEKNPHEIATANIATAMHMENTDQFFSHNDSISQAKQVQVV